MGMVEDTNGNLSEPFPLSADEVEKLNKARALFEEVKIGHDNNVKSVGSIVHLGIKDELQRHKDLMEKLFDVEKKLNRILIHFDLAKAGQVLPVDG